MYLRQASLVSGKCFFNALLSSKAHWYRIITLTSDKPQQLLIKSTFPSLSTLFSLDEYFTCNLLVQLGLAWYKKGSYSPLKTAWDNFIAEFKLHAEVTNFSINGRRPAVKVPIQFPSFKFPH